MKRFWMILALVALVATFGVVGAVYAQDGTPPTPPVPGQGYGPGMMGRGGMMAGEYGQGWMHEYMAPAVAEKLGLSVEELEAQHAEGKTFWQIAEEKGINLEDAQQLMIDARTSALDAAVTDGVITQEQADFMKTRMGSGHMRGGRMGGCGMGTPNGLQTGTPRGRMGGGGRW